MNRAKRTGLLNLLRQDLEREALRAGKDIETARKYATQEIRLNPLTNRQLRHVARYALFYAR